MTSTTNAAPEDALHLRRAIRLAEEAEKRGNLPIGAVVCLEGQVIAEGRNAIWKPVLDLTRHAEIEALRGVAASLWSRAGEMALYTTLEPCLMCAGAIMLHRIGKVVFGATDAHGGVGCTLAHLPEYFQERFSSIQWIGPALPDECDPLFARVLEAIEERERTRGDALAEA